MKLFSKTLLVQQRLADNTSVQVGLIAIITGFATASVVSGLDGGVRRLSEPNIRLAGLFALFVLLFEQTDWQNSWTVLYWGWWVSWSLFVGIFIARISKGRTVREFVLGVLLLPSMLTFLWMSIFGGTALFLELSQQGAAITQAVEDNIATALFVMLQQLPLTGITSLIGIILVTVFFVTSSDSGSLVVDNLTSGGKLDSPTPQRVFWAIIEGVIAAALLLGGSLQALQTASITTGLPFAVVLLVMCFSLDRDLNEELAMLEAEELRATEVEKSLVSLKHP